MNTDQDLRAEADQIAAARPDAIISPRVTSSASIFATNAAVTISTDGEPDLFPLTVMFRGESWEQRELFLDPATALRLLQALDGVVTGCGVCGGALVRDVGGTRCLGSGLWVHDGEHRAVCVSLVDCFGDEGGI